MPRIGFATSPLRPATGDAARRVTFVELFFDLVFVFAITQLSHLLIAHPSALGLLQTVILAVEVWWVWVDTAWVTNWLDPDRRSVRVMLIVLMLLGMLVSVAIPHAFGDTAVLFAVSVVTLQVVRSVFTAVAFGRDRRRALNFVRIAIWLAFSGSIWIAGAFAPEEARLWIWLAALLIDSAGPRMRYWVPGLGASDVSAWDVTGEHMAERVSLFVIIALGESIIVTGTTFSEHPFELDRILAFLAAFVSTVLLWLLYFNHSQRKGSEFISNAAERGLIAQVAYTYVPIVMVLGIVLSAVGDELVLGHPLAAVDSWTAGIVCVASMTYVLGNALFRRATGGPWLVSHLLAVVAIGVLFLLSPLLTALALSWLVNAVLAAVVVVDELHFARDTRESRTVAA